MNPLTQYSQAAHRASGIVRELIAEGRDGEWVALRLSDGGTDGVVYAERADAVRHQLHEQQCAYLFIPPDNFSARSAENFLKHHRQMYDAGYRLADPDAQVIPMIPQRMF